MTKATRIARELFKKYKLSIPVDVKQLVDDMGITLKESDLDSMSGFAYRKDGQQVIGVNASEGEERKKFTIAHELGHMQVHASNDVLFDKKADLVYFRDDHSSTGQSFREIEANAFAAELLMPYDKLTKSISKLGGVDPMDDEAISQLANQYGVSFTAMSIRVSSLAKLSMPAQLS